MIRKKRKTFSSILTLIFACTLATGCGEDFDDSDEVPAACYSDLDKCEAEFLHCWEQCAIHECTLACFKANERCTNRADCCPKGYPVRCGSFCCDKDSVCCKGGCCPKGYPVNCGSYSCDKDSECCKGGCCPKGFPVDCGSYYCEVGSVCSKGDCCSKDYPVSCGNGYCAMTQADCS